MPHTIQEHPVGRADRPFRVVCIGAGLSGIYLGIRIPQYLDGVELQIYEKNNDLAGTWHENTYSGVACDIPAHAYQYSFDSNTQWSKYYAPGAEIKEYYRSMAIKYGAAHYVKLGHQVTKTVWEDSESLWKLTVLDLANNKTFEDTANVVISCTGFLNDWKWPEIPGLRSYKGHLVHSAVWKHDFDWVDKEIAVIGNGSSAIQIVPSLQPKTKRIDHYARSRTWISLPFAGEEAVKRNPTGQNFEYTEEEKKRFASDPAYYHQYRKDIERELNLVHASVLRGSELQAKGRELFTESMRNKLAKKPWLFDIMKPAFAVACRRLTPGPGYLEALTEDNVDVITTRIKEITPTGIVTEDGKERRVDAIVCATGFDTASWRIDSQGKDGIKLKEQWRDHPQAYMSLATENFPNWFFMLGPNAGVGSGSLVILMERTADYIVQALQKMKREAIISMTIKSDAFKEFNDYIDAFFPRTVYTDNCRSWYKASKSDPDRITGLWPGSCLHGVETVTHPRWEDWDYKYAPGYSRFGWLGNGWSAVELEGGDTANYLENCDTPDPESLQAKYRAAATHRQQSKEGSA